MQTPPRRKYANQAERQRAYRERNKLVPVTVELPQEVAAALRAYHARQLMDGPALTLGQVVAKLVTQQLTRKR